MEETLVSFKVAKLAKEKGFNPPLNVYNDVFDLEDGQPMFNVHRDTLLSSKNTWILRPTQSLLQKWLREEHDLVFVYAPEELPDNNGDYENLWHKWKISEFDGWRGGRRNTITTKLVEDFEEALEEGLLQALQLINYE